MSYGKMCRKHRAPHALCGCAVPAMVHMEEPATATPPWLASAMLDAAGFASGETILDPCAGTGTILEEARRRGASWTEFFELSEKRVQQLKAAGFTGTHADMHNITRTAVYNVVALNPDFRHQRWAQMVPRAWTFVQPGCTLVAVVPRDVSGMPMHPGQPFERMLYDSASHSTVNLHKANFTIEGRPVPASILVVRRLAHAAPPAEPAPELVHA